MKTVEQLTTELEETKKQLAALREACEAHRAAREACDAQAAFPSPSRSSAPLVRLMKATERLDVVLRHPEATAEEWALEIRAREHDLSAERCRIASEAIHGDEKASATLWSVMRWHSSRAREIRAGGR